MRDKKALDRALLLRKQGAAALGNPVAAAILGNRVAQLQQAVAKMLEPWTKAQWEGAVTGTLKPATQHLQGCNVRVLSTDVTLSPVDDVAQMCNVQLPENIVAQMRASAEKAGWTSLKQQ